MPIFEVQKDGRTFEIDAPSMAAAAAVFNTGGVSPSAATISSRQPSIWDRLSDLQGLPGVAVGAVQEAASSVAALGDLARAGWNAVVPGGRFDVARPNQYYQVPDPRNQYQRLGQRVVQAAPIVAGAPAAVGAASKALPVVPRLVQGAMPYAAGALGAKRGYDQDGVLGAAAGAIEGAAYGTIAGQSGRLLSKLGTWAATKEAAKQAARSADDVAASARMTTGMGQAGRAAATTAANNASNVHTRTGFNITGLMMNDMSNVQIADRIKEIKTLRRVTTDPMLRQSFDTELAVLEKAERQRQHITYKTGVAQARKESRTEQIAREIIKETEKQ